MRALEIVVGTAVGGIIYGIFLQALLVQSLIIDRKPLDPAQWREKLSGRAWIVGLLMFMTLIFVPLRFLTRKDCSLVLTDVSEGGVVWFLIAIILLIQIATVRYASMRPELCTVEHPVEHFTYGCTPHSSFTITYALGLWKNWVQILIIAMEFIQLISMALDGSGALQGAGIRFLSPEFLTIARQFKEVVWQFGMVVPDAGGVTGTYDTGFGMLCGFSGLYIFLCGVFIALDLNADSSLSPLLFTILAGGFYGSITSGLLLVIFYSGAAAQVIVSLIMLAYYSSTAVFVSIYRSDAKKMAAGEIRLMPAFTAVERVSKGILAAVSVASNSGVSSVRAVAALVFCVYLIVLLVWIRPYSVFGMTAIRISTVAIAGWTALIVVCASAVVGDAHGTLLTTLLSIGWVIIPVILFVVANCFQKKSMPRSIFRSESIAVITIDNPLKTANSSDVVPLQRA